MKGVGIRVAGVLFMIMTLVCSCQELFKIFISSDEAYSDLIPYPYNYRLMLTSYELTFDSSSVQSQVIEVRSTDASWEFTDIPDWIRISPSSGNSNAQVTVSVAENTGTSGRVGVVKFCSTVENWKYSSILTVSQERALCFAVPKETYVEFEGQGGSKTIEVDANTDEWSVTCSSSIEWWCTVSKTDAGINIHVNENSYKKPREGLLKISTPDSESFINVFQHPTGVRTTAEKLSFAPGAGSQKVSFTAFSHWSAWASDSWIDVEPKQGVAGECEITVMVTENKSMSQLTGHVYIYSESNTADIPVFQEGYSLDVNKDEYSLPKSGGDIQLSIQSNTSWSFSGDMPSWISSDAMSGTGDGGVTLTVSSNQSAKRSATLRLYVASVGEWLGIPIVINQDGYTFETDSTALLFSDLAGNEYFHVLSDADWIAVASAPWITLSPESGTGNATINVSVTENTSDTTRVGFVAVSIYGKCDTINIYQIGKYLNVSSELLNFTSKGGQTVISVKTKSDWTAECSEPWISLSATEGSGDCNLTISAHDNPSAEPRSCNVLINHGEFSPVLVHVNQLPRNLALSVDTIEFFSKGGVSNPVMVRTDGVFQVTTDDDWLSITKEFENSFTITAAKNENYEDRIGKVTVELTNLISGVLSKDLVIVQSHNTSYQYVDLGLSVLWAAFNIGATAPEEYGDYYAWGEIEPKTTYSWSNYKYCNGSSEALTKYCHYSYYGDGGYTDTLRYLEPQDDVAHVKWGDEWRMPTDVEYYELIENCSWHYISINGVKGYQATSKISGYENCSIFFPSTGHIYNDELRYDGFFGNYWSNLLLANNTSDRAYALDFSSTSNNRRVLTYPRNLGLPVRAVRRSDNYFSTVTSVELSETELDIIISDSVRLTTIPKNKAGGHVNADVQWSSSDDAVATVSESGVVYGIGAGSCTITASVGNVKTSCDVMVTLPSSPANGYDNGLGYVDLGLSVKWATFNVGASLPEDYGNYYAWGETETKSNYNFGSYKWSSGIYYTKYYIKGGRGSVDNKTMLEPDDDVAHVVCGGNWRMPTKDEQDELIENCTWRWITYKGVNGYKVTSNMSGYNGRSIFLPAGGCRYEGIANEGEYGYYWSSSCDPDNSPLAFHLHISSDGYECKGGDRITGFSVRAVCP